jgi:Ca2+-binding RTX toxin-like protein
MPTVQGTNNSETIDQADGVTNFDDTIFGYGGADTIFGLNGDDTLKGGGGADELRGGVGSDTVDYSDSTVGVLIDLWSGHGYEGTAEGDTYYSIENVSGSAYDDNINGDSAINDLYGWNGSDWLHGRGGADHLDGGLGNDFAAYYLSAAGVTINLAANTAHGGDAEGDTFTSIEHLYGSDHDDVVFGDNNDNNLLGAAGNDTLKGGGGDDGLQGGVGADLMMGSSGDDVYFIDNVLDDVIEWNNEGSDTVHSDISYTLPDHVESLRLTGSGNINGTGNELNNTIWGTDAANVINGAEGADWMRGYLGNDIYYVDNANDQVIESGGQGIDEVRAGVSWTINGNADVETLCTTSDAGVAAINLTGNSTGNTVRGNNGANVINGGGGTDTLTGLGGADTFLFTAAPTAGAATITDLNLAQDDTIRLYSASFPLGMTVDSSEFVIGGAAQDANDNLIYNSANGQLLWDADGTGPMAAIHFATLPTNLPLSHDDFSVMM